MSASGRKADVQHAPINARFRVENGYPHKLIPMSAHDPTRTWIKSPLHGSVTVWGDGLLIFGLAAETVPSNLRVQSAVPIAIRFEIARSQKLRNQQNNKSSGPYCIPGVTNESRGASACFQMARLLVS